MIRDKLFILVITPERRLQHMYRVCTPYLISYRDPMIPGSIRCRSQILNGIIFFSLFSFLFFRHWAYISANDFKFII